MSAIKPFNQQLESISDSPGTNTWYDRLFLISNERNKERKLKTLSKQPIVGNTIIGVSGMHSLNIAAIRGKSLSTEKNEIEHILIFDRSLRVEHFWKNAQVIISKAQNRTQACLELCELVLKNHEFYYGGSNRGTPLDQAHSWISKFNKEEFKTEISWLSNDESFQRIQKIFKENHFHFKRFDAIDVKAFESLGLALQESSLRVDTLYISNVLEYVETESEGVSKFRESMKHLIGEGTLVVDTKTRKGGADGSEPLEQRLRKCTNVNKEAPVDELFVPSPELQTQKIEA